jgi:hypothetical protein
LREALRIRSGLASRDRLVRAWIREDPLLGYLVWAGPLSTGQRGLLTTQGVGKVACCGVSSG